MSEQSVDRIRLYRFLQSKWALRAIETRELRVGRLAELNDPFEFVPGIDGLLDDAPVDFVREQLWRIQADLNSEMGLLSFSSTCREPTLWSHYAESHKGIALGFDVTRHENLDEVKYPDPAKRPTIHPGNPDPAAWMECVIKTLTTKALGWKMESEYRTTELLSSCRYEDGHYFVPIEDSTRVLAHVILGSRCSVDEGYVYQALKQSNFHEVRVVRAKLSINTFEVES